MQDWSVGEGCCVGPIVADGGYQIHGPYRIRISRDGIGVQNVKSPSSGNDGCGSMTFPLVGESDSLVPLPGSPPYDSPRAAMWVVDLSGRAGPFEIHGRQSPGQGCFLQFRRRGVAPPFFE